MRLSFIVVFLLVAWGSAAQSRTEDVVYLQNGGSMRGKVIADDGKGITIRAKDGSVFVLKKEEVVRVATEPAFGSYQYKEKGFSHFTELGPLVAGKTTIDGVTTAAFAFQTVNGYKLNQYAFTGIGVGVDLYATQTIIPVFGSFRGDIRKDGSVIPFYFLDAGYGFNITQNSSAGEDFKGGLMYAAGLGMKIPFNRTAGFLLSMGYRYQRSEYLQNSATKTVTYSRLAIRAGFFL